MKRIFSILLSLCLLLTCVGATAEGGVNAMLYQQSEDGDGSTYIQSATAVGNVVYVLTNTSIDQWVLGDAEPVKLLDNQGAYTANDVNAIKDAGGVSATLLFNDGANVFALSATGVVWQLTGTPDGKPAFSVQLAWDEMKYTYEGDDSESYRSLYDPKVMDGKLYGLYTDWDEGQGTTNVYGWTLATGEKLETRKGTLVKSLDLYKDGLFLSKIFDEANSWDAATQTQRCPKIGTFNPATGETVELLETTDYNTCGMRYDAASDKVYYACGTKVYSVDSTFKDPKISAYLPTQVWDEGCTMLVGGTYVIANYSGLLARELDPAGIENGALTIYGDYGSEAHQAFVAAHPSMPVTCSDNYYTNLEEFTNAMVADTNVMDVLRLTSSYSPLERLVQKGYALDLSSDAELVAFVQTMYPEIANYCTKDGKLYALPTSLYATTIGYYKDTWESLGLTEDDLPKSVYELLDFVENWMYDYGEEHSDVRLFDNTNTQSTIINMILEQYIAYYDKLGEPLSFDTELFRKLMTKLDGIDFSEIDPEESEQDDDEFWSRPMLFSSYASVTYPGQMSDESITPILIPLDEGVEPVIPADLNVLIVNPRTTRTEQAFEYLRNYSQHLDADSANIVMFPDHNDPVPNKYFEENVKAWQEQLDNGKKALETAEPEDAANIQSDIDYFTDLLNNTDKYRYTVSAEAIAAYREKYAPYLHVMSQNPLSTWDNDGENQLWSQINQYTQKAITLDEFIKNIDQRVRLMQLEDQ